MASPAGLDHAGDLTAKRELAEETDLIADDWSEPLVFFSAPFYDLGKLKLNTFFELNP